MKPCHENNVLQFMLEGPQLYTILCSDVNNTVEYRDRNSSIGQLLRHFSKSIVVYERHKKASFVVSY